ncbi:hypothetical protein LCGC14_0164230 [marine sediment metagenome]|uniref:Uncharacterized protein n=1 Tax=marine sediment metagenome TaxID=412755 RepID=A0A0F9UYJ3_9ZZZZ
MDPTRTAMRRIMLTEAADAAVPQYFYLALDFGSYNYDEMLANLMSGRLEGLKGIGATSIQDMIMDWGQLRELLIRMPGDDVAALNDVSMIRYDDPAYLMANNMEALGRLFNSPGDPQQILTKMGSYVLKALRDFGAAQQHYGFQYSGPLQSFGHWIARSGRRINSVDDMVRLFLQFLDEEHNSDDPYRRAITSHLDYDQPDFPDASEWKKWFHQGVKNMGALYSAEVEWAVKSGALKVPESSDIWVISPEQKYMDAYPHWKKTGEFPFLGKRGYAFDTWTDVMKSVDRWHEAINQLRTKYASVKIVSVRRAEKEKTKLFARRERQRQAGD